MTACLNEWIGEKLLLGSSTPLTSWAAADLDTPQDQVGDARKHNGQFEANVHTVRLIDQATYGSSDGIRDAVYCEDLGKTKASTYQTNHH